MKFSLLLFLFLFWHSDRQSQLLIWIPELPKHAAVVPGLIPQSINTLAPPSDINTYICICKAQSQMLSSDQTTLEFCVYIFNPTVRMTQLSSSKIETKQKFK